MDQHEAVTRSYPIPGHMWPSELCWAYQTFSQSKRHAEIGVFCGRSLFASCAGMRDSFVLAVDVPPYLEMDVALPSLEWLSRTRENTIETIRDANQTISLTYDDSGSLAAARKYIRKQQFDSVFIDALHNYSDVVADISEWLPLVKRGGIISGHDYSSKDPGVMDAVNELLPKFNIVQHTRIWWHRV